MASFRDRVFILKLRKQGLEVLKKAKQYKKLSDEKLKQKTEKFKKMLKSGKVTVNDILVDAYAVCYEAARRTMGYEIFLVQIIGAIVLNNGDVAEMKTGEGKTLTALLPIYLNALTGKGVHVITVNEYLAQRDADYNRPALESLGITVGVNKREFTPAQKREAYAQDVTYTTNAEDGFDYLRDNMARSMDEKVQRKLNFAIIDEADSVLIDEARTPLIISGGKRNRASLYAAADAFAKSLNKEEDCIIDLESKQISLSPSGVKKAEKFFGLKNLFALENAELFHNILNALKAVHVFEDNVEYVVRDGEIVLVDQFTGRLMPGRAYSDGLQQAIQAKEHLKVEEETTTLATITYQNFFRLYSKVSGMTGTAKTEEEEFLKIYNMRVFQVPTNKPMIRVDSNDEVYATQSAKFKALLNKIKKAHERGQPILVGTTSVEVSEHVANLLTKHHIPHEVLNAKNHEKEADIIAHAGEKGAVTISTNMAGRGTDIKLGSGVLKLGGLLVLGTERHESRRIDNQLRGRSGRQGDIGASTFYISVEDEIMQRFGTEKLKQIFSRLGEEAIQSRMLTRAITAAQKKVEGLNFDSRKNVLDYDNVLAQQRNVMYKQRDEILSAPDLTDMLIAMSKTAGQYLISQFTRQGQKETIVDYPSLIKKITGVLIVPNSLSVKQLKGLPELEAANIIGEAIWTTYDSKVSEMDKAVRTNMERQLTLQTFDNYWMKHIDDSTRLRTGIYLRSYAQINPLQAYIEESEKLFRLMRSNISLETFHQLTHTINAAQNPNDIAGPVLEAIERTKRESKMGG